MVMTIAMLLLFIGFFGLFYWLIPFSQSVIDRQ